VTNRAAFTDEEWDLLREAPEEAGLIVITAEGGGTFRETFALAKAYTEARKQHGASELLDQLADAGPKRGPRAHSEHELREHGLQKLRDARALLEQKATSDEVDGYRAFVLALTERVAAAHKEDGQQVSPSERAAIKDIEETLTS
jgi:hypothetical protein